MAGAFDAGGPPVMDEVDEGVDIAVVVGVADVVVGGGRDVEALEEEEEDGDGKGGFRVLEVGPPGFPK